MKYITSTLLLLMGQFMFVFSQDKSTIVRSKTIKIEVHSFSNEKLKGHLKSFSDSTIVVYLVKSKETVEFHYRDLSLVRVNKNRAKLIGFLAGTATGILIDAVLISNEFGAENEIPVGPVLTILSIPIAGGLTGAIIAKRRISYTIEGKLDNFSAFKKKISKP